MKRKVFCFLLAVLAIAIFSLGCGGGGGSHSNPASPAVSGTARVSGVIVDSSKKPAENVDVRLALVSKPGLNALPENFRAVLRLATADTQTEFNTTTDKNGVYSFENVPYGRYSLSVDAGTQGAYVANLVVAEENVESSPTIKPFGFVSGKVVTKNGDNDIQVYGAMVEACGIRAFTNNAGEFTLSHIPVGEEFGLTATLQGYTAETASFTIPATGTLTLELENPIEIKPIQSELYSVKASVTGIENVDLPIYVIAQHSSIKDKIYFNTIKENPDKKTTLECSVNIVDAGDYNIFALSADRKETKAISHSTSASEKNVTLAFESETANDKNVNIRKVLPDHDCSPETLNYYDNYVSGIGTEGDGEGELCYINVDDETDKGMYSIESNAVICGKYSVFHSDSSESFNFYYADDRASEGTIEQFTIFDSPTDSNPTYVAFVPDKYVVVNLYSNSSYKRYYETRSFSSLSTSIRNNYGLNPNEEIYLYCDTKMAMDSYGDCYLAVMYSGETIDLRIYKVQSGDSNPIVSYSYSSGEPYIKDFKVLRDGSFYVETTINIESLDQTGTQVRNEALLFASSGGTPTISSSNRKGCFIDSENNMYRYDSSKLAVVKTATLDGEPIESYKLQTTTTSGTTTADVNGVLGYRETDDSIDIFVY